MGPITTALSLSFITQFVCTLILGLALPAHPSNTQTHTRACMLAYTHFCPLTVGTLPSWTLRDKDSLSLSCFTPTYTCAYEQATNTCTHMLHAWHICSGRHTLISTPTYVALTHTLMLTVQMGNSPTLVFLSQHSIIVTGPFSSALEVYFFLYSHFLSIDTSPTNKSP